MNAEESERQKNQCQPQARDAGDDHDGHTLAHTIGLQRLAGSGHVLEEREQQREDGEGEKRTEANEGEPPQWL